MLLEPPALGPSTPENLAIELVSTLMEMEWLVSHIDEAEPQ